MLEHLAALLFCTAPLQAVAESPLEAFVARLNEDPLLAERGVIVIDEHPLHPVLGVGAPAEELPLALELSAWLAAQRALIAGSELCADAVRSAAAERFLPVVCLRDRGLFESLTVELLGGETPSGPGSRYDPVAVYAPQFGGVLARDGERDEEYPRFRRQAALFAVAHELLVEQVPEDARGAHEEWLVAGLAERFTVSAGDDPEAFGTTTLDPSLLRETRRLIDRSDWFEYAWVPITELVATRGARPASAVIDRRFGATASPNNRGAVTSVFSIQACLWVRFLEQLPSGDSNALAVYAPMGLAGRGGMEALLAAASFEGVLPLRTAYFDWVAETVLSETRIRMSRPDLSPKAPEPEKGEPVGPESAVPDMTGESAAPDVPEFAPDPLLAFAPTDPGAQEALALGDARIGDFEGALQRLAAIDVEDPQLDSEARPRIARQLERLEVLEAARATLIERALEGVKLKVVRNGETDLLEALAIEGEELTIKPSSKHDWTRLYVDQLDARSLALNWKRRSERYGPGWIEAYALWICGDEDWEKAMPKDPADAELEPDLLAARALPDVATGLQLLMESRDEALEPPQSAAVVVIAPGVDELLAVASVFTPDGPRAVDRAAFRSAVRDALDRASEELELGDLIAGQVESAGEGRVRLTYGLGADENSPDFAPAGDLWMETGSPSEVGLPASEAPSPSRKGAVFSGSDCFVHKLVLAPPVSVAFEVNWMYGDAQETLGGLTVGLGYEQHVHSIQASALATLFAASRDRKFSQSIEGPPMSAFRDKAYEFELTYDGRRAQFLSGSSVRLELPVENFPAGRIVFGTRTDHDIVVRNVVIEGAVDEQGLGALRGEWSAAELERLLGAREGPKEGRKEGPEQSAE